ncbi:MAG: histidine kinase [Chitinophagaceae bacterium]|nr:histidine kinase [Chitinophagaceae bacterium]
MKKIKWHLYGLLIYSTIVLSLDYFFLGSAIKWKNEFIVLLDQFWVFYTVFAILYFSFLAPSSKKIIAIPITILSVGGTYLITYLYCKVNPETVYTTKSIIYSIGNYYAHFSLYSLGYFFVERSFQKQKKIRFIEKQQAEMAKANLEIENKNLRLNEDFLRAQINPHFLYNCLNFFYSETFEKNPYVGEGILMLADIMRYSLKDYSKTNGLTDLSEEIEHIENVINIHQKRFVNTLNISIKVEGNLENKLITPMVLITMVENVFKHGDLHDRKNPALINCYINEETQKVHFTTYNTKSRGPKDPSTGIGLNNIKQRLQSLYKNNFSIDTSEEMDTYKKELIIPYFKYSDQKDSISKMYNQAVC